jgi:hypothetical protein
MKTIMLFGLAILIGMKPSMFCMILRKLLMLHYWRFFGGM